MESQFAKSLIGHSAALLRGAAFGSVAGLIVGGLFLLLVKLWHRLLG